MNKPDLINRGDFLMINSAFDQRILFAPEIEFAKNGMEGLLASGLINQENKSSLIDYRGKVAVLTIDGPMRPGKNWLFSVGYGDIQEAIVELIDNKEITTVIQMLRTPGGTVDQAFETEEMFYELAKEKRLISAIETATSAGALMTFPASERYLVSKTAQTGSIGVVAEHVDARKFYEFGFGEVRTSVAKGEMKDAGTDTRGYDEKAKEVFTESVNTLYNIFADSAAKGLGLSREKIDSMQSRVYIGQDGIDQGFANGFATLEQLVEKYNKEVVFTTPGRPAFSNIQTESKPMDINKLKAENPDVYQAILDEGKKLGAEAFKETHLAEGQAKGILEERKRISGIKALALPGQETLMEQFIKDGISESEAAVKFLSAQKEVLAKMKTGIEADLKDGIATDVPKAPVDPAAKSEDPVKEFNAKVAEKEKTGMKHGDAIKAAAKENVELHQKYINALNGGK